MSKFGFVGRRWVEFVKGYAGYLTFIVNFSTFVTVLYGLNTFVQESFKFTTFVIGMVVIVTIVATLIGHMHYRKQYPNEMDVGVLKNPYTFKMVPNSKEVPLYNALLILLNDKLEKTDTKDTEKLRDISNTMVEIDNLMKGKDMREK